MVGKWYEIADSLIRTKDNNKVYELKEYKPRRSLMANNYMWELISKLAYALKRNEDDIYLKALKDYGTSSVISVIAEVDIKHFIKYYEEFGESELNGKLFKHYRVYKGSSEMNTAEMSRLIQGIVEECKEQGIETIPPSELKSLMESWKD